MSDRNIFRRWARTERAISIAALFGVLAVVLVSIVESRVVGNDPSVTGVFLLGFIAVLASMPAYERRVEKMRRGKEILNRYSAERHPRPLGL